MAISRASVFVLIVLCQTLGFATAQQPNLASFGDFMEVFLSVNHACMNVTDAQNSTRGIFDMFTQCTFRLTSTPPKDEFENMVIICKNRDQYFSCWDKLKTDTLRTCGKDKESMLPVVYRATVAAMCGSDNGAKRIAELKQAVQEITEEAQNQCPEETGEHWLNRCQSLVTLMNSPDACNRHSAINECLSRITCDNIKFAKLLRTIYSDGKTDLKC